MSGARHPQLASFATALVFTLGGGLGGALLLAPGAALAEEEASTAARSWDLPFQRLSVGATLGGMGLAGGQISLGFDPYSQVQFEAAARMFTGSMEQQNEQGFPDYDPACTSETDVYPCAANATMFSVGLILANHTTWDKINPGVAVRTGVSTLGEIYTSAGGYVEGGLNENHTVTWTGELSVGYWFKEPHRAPTDLLALPWDGVEGSGFDLPSERFLAALRLGIQWYPIR